MNRTQGATNREIPVARSIPYQSHVSPHVVTTTGGDLVAVFKIAGIAHESADVEDLDAYHSRLNGLLRTIQSPKVTLWPHTVREERRDYPAGEFAPGSFAGTLNERYRQRVTRGRMMVNDLYLTVVYSPDESKFKKFIARIFDRLSVAEMKAKFDQSMDDMEEVCRTIEAGLRDYAPSRLGWYEHEVAPGNTIMFSEVLEFFGFLLNGEWQRWPVPRMRPGQDVTIGSLLSTARPFFGGEAFELRGATSSTIGAILALKEYPDTTAPGFMNKLLSLPFPFVLTQSFRFIPKQPAIRMLTVQQAKMAQSGEVAVSQVAEITSALDDVGSGRFVMGEHHLSLAIFASDVRTLNENVALARNNLSDAGAVAVREDWGLEAAFFSQLPGNFSSRTRPAPISSRNFAGFASMHTHPSGLADGNQWGPAVALFKTASGTPYYFSFHIPPKRRRHGEDALREDNVKADDRVPGNTMIIGPTGSGKTVLQGLLLAQLEKFEPTVFYFDKDRGMEILIRAVGGTYLTIKNGERTGFNPFLLADTPGNLTFLQALVRKLVTADGHHLTPSEERAIDDGITGVLGLPRPQRRLVKLLDFLDVSDPDGAAARLNRWVLGGALAWVFDNDVDLIDPAKHRVNGFDITDLLDNDTVREPVLMYLLHRQEEVIDGRRIMIGFDEGWKVLYDPWLSVYLENKLKTIRKQNGFIVFGTQSPSDVLKARIADTLVQQSVTQIYLPNPKASHADYVGGFKLSEREFEIIQSDMPAMPNRHFLVKQGTHSAICELNLGGLDDELAVLSGTTATVELLQQILPETGPNPADWLPVFHERRRF